MRKPHLLALVALAFFTHCAPTKTASPGVFIDTQKLNGRNFQKLFVVFETVDVQLRKMVETDIVEALHAKGYAGIKSLDMIPFSLKELKLPTDEEIKQKAKESGCDGILLMSIFRQGETLEYTPGIDVKENEQIGAGLLRGALNRGGDVKPIPSVNTPGSFSHTPTAFIFKAGLFDLPAADLMFSFQSDRMDLSSLDKKSKSYAEALVEQLQSKRLLK